MLINDVKKLSPVKQFSAGKAYTDTWQGEWAYLYSLVKDHPNNGSFSFVPQPAEKEFSSWELGSLRVSPSTNSDGMWCVHTLPVSPKILMFDSCLELKLHNF